MAGPTAADLRAILNLAPEAAITYLERKGFRITWDWHAVDAATHARAFTVAKMTRLDLLRDVRNALTDNLAKGQTLRDFQRNLRPLLEAKGWWGRQIVVNPAGEAQPVQLGSPRRLATIYQTNLQSAYMGARYAEALKASATHPYWMYVAVMDSVTRPSHAALHGKVFRYDDPIWQHIMPPNGYNCRCRFVALSEAEVRRRGLKVESSVGKTGSTTLETGVDARTGEIRSQTVTTLQTTSRAGKPVLFRPDAGFDGSPLQSHLMDELLLDKASRTLGAPAALAEVRQVLLDPVRIKGWQAFVATVQDNGHKQGQSMAFGVLDARDLAFAQAQGAVVRSAIVFLQDYLLMGRKARRHDGVSNALTQAELMALPERFANPERVLWDVRNQTLLYIFPAEDGRSGKIAVRFKGERYAKAQVEDVATLFKVAPADIEAGIKGGQYLPVR